jgi:hypothetical protein
MIHDMTMLLVFMSQKQNGRQAFYRSSIRRCPKRLNPPIILLHCNKVSNFFQSPDIQHEMMQRVQLKVEDVKVRLILL